MLFRTIIFIAGVFCIALLGCSGQEEYVLAEPEAAASATPIKVKFYLETSLSMKGYVVSDQSGDFSMKLVVPRLVETIDSRVSDFQIFTVEDRPKAYEKTASQFAKEVRTGYMFSGKSSKLQNVFLTVIDSLRENEVAILVSDCIMDLGGGQTIVNKAVLTTEIAGALYDKQDFGAAVFQYYSDFNPNYYYNRRGYERPFHNESGIMKKRPYYVWVFGSKKAIYQFLELNLLGEYKNSHSFDLSFAWKKVEILRTDKRGAININSAKRLFIAEKASEKRPMRYLLGVNGVGVPNYIFNEGYLQRNLVHVPASPIPLVRVLSTSDVEQLKCFPELQPSIDKHGLTNFIEFTFTETPSFDSFKHVIRNADPLWVKNTSVEDDLSLSMEELEGKTFAFEYLYNAFKEFERDASMREHNGIDKPTELIAFTFNKYSRK